MGFFSSIKRLWSSKKTAENPETPQVPAEEALAAQPAETEDGASHEESSVSDAPQSPVEVVEKLPETAAAEQQQADLEMDQLTAGQSLEPDGQAPAPAAAAQPAPQPDAPKEPSGWRDTLLLTLREAEPRLSVWLSIALEDLGPDARTGDELWERVRFLLTALGAPENEADAFVADFAAWAARMEYEEVADFRSELQYRLALALDLEDEEDERNRIFLKLHQGLERTREQLGKGLSTLFASHGDLIGKNLFECHSEPSQAKIRHMLATGESNAYTIEKNGLHKVIYQTPWRKDGKIAGMVEISMIVPPEMPHYIR